MSDLSGPVGEDDLQAFVDGRLSEARRSAVDAYLATRPDIMERLAVDTGHRDTLRGQLAAKLAEPVPGRLRVAAIRASQRHARWKALRATAAAAALFVVGAGGGWFARTMMPMPTSADASPPAALAVAHDAATAYRVFVVEVAHPVEVGAADEAHLVQWLSKRLGRPLQAPDLARHGFRLMGGRLLPADSGAAAQFMYVRGDGRRLTVYIRAGSGEQAAFRFRQDGATATFVWLDQGFGFAVTADFSREALLPVAEAVYRTYDPEARLPH